MSDRKILYVYCKPGATQWNYINVEDGDWITYKNEWVKWGQIHGGYVDTDINFKKVYLFGSRLTSSNRIVRKFLYECDYEYIGEVSDH